MTVHRFGCTLGLDVFALLIDFVAKKFNPADPAEIVFRQKLFQQSLSLLGNSVFVQRQHDVIVVDCVDKHGY